MSTLDKLAFNLTVQKKPTGSLLRSQSEDNMTGETPVALARRAYSMTILELGTVGFERQKTKIPPSVYNPMKEMMANFEAQGRSKDSISTVIQSEIVLPVDQAEQGEAVVLFRHQNTIQAAVGSSEVDIGSLLTEEHGPRSIGYQSHPPRSVLFYSSNSAIQPGASTGYFGFRDEEPIPLDPGLRDEGAAPVEPNEPSNIAAREVSEASTDWEYGHSRSHSKNAHSPEYVHFHSQNVSPLTQWQTSGLTRSELEYHNRFNTVRSREGSISIEIEVEKLTPKVSRRSSNTEKRSQKSIPASAVYEYEPSTSPIPPRPMSPMHGRRSSHPLHYHESPDENPQRRHQRRDRGESSRQDQLSFRYHRQQNPPRGSCVRNHAQTETDGYDDKSSSSDSNERRHLPILPVKTSYDLIEPPQPITVQSSYELIQIKSPQPLAVHSSSDVNERRRPPTTTVHGPSDVNDRRLLPTTTVHGPSHVNERRRVQQITLNVPSDEHERRRQRPTTPDDYERRRQRPITPDEYERRRQRPTTARIPSDVNERRPQPNTVYDPSDENERIRQRPTTVHSPSDERYRQRPTTFHNSSDANDRRRQRPIPIQSSSDLDERRDSQTNSIHSSSDLDERRRPQSVPVYEIDPVGTSSSGMSPTCRLINRLVKRSSPRKDQKLMRAIYAHRSVHIDNVKEELHRLEKLNAALSRGTEDLGVDKKSIQKKPTRRPPNLSPPPRPKTTLMYRRTLSPSRDHRRVRTAAEKNSCGVRNEVTNTSRILMHNTGTQVSHPSLSNKSRPSSAAAATQFPTPEASTSSSTAAVTLDQKVEQLLCTFNFIADFLCLNQEAAEEAKNNQQLVPECPCPKKKRQPKKPKPPKPPKPPVSYFIPFSNCHGEQMYLQYGRQRSPPSLSSSEKENDGHVNGRQGSRGADSDEGRDGRYNTNEFLGRFSLQEIFRKNNPEFIDRIQQREAVLSKLKAEREHRADVKRQWIQTHGPHELSSLERALEPREPRLMSGREMREITKKKYTKLPEVQEKKLQKKVEEEKRTNRLMSHVFAKKLRQGVLRGNVNMDMSKSIIANATFR